MIGFVRWYRKGLADLFNKWSVERWAASEMTARAWSRESGLSIEPDQLGALHQLNLAMANLQRAIAEVVRPNE